MSMVLQHNHEHVNSCYSMPRSQKQGDTEAQSCSSLVSLVFEEYNGIQSDTKENNLIQARFPCVLAFRQRTGGNGSAADRRNRSATNTVKGFGSRQEEPFGDKHG